MPEAPNLSQPPDPGPTQAYDELPPRLLRKLKVSVPGYKLQNVIARGGQGIVIKAVQSATGKLVAIKLLREGPLADSAARSRLQREIAVMATLDHPNIVPVIDSGVTLEGLDYLVMNYIAGRSLNEFIAESRTIGKPATDGQSAPVAADDPAAPLKLFTKICEAVNAAHLQGIVHRDLSPSNVMIDEQGQPHILDFGLARTAFDRFFAGGGKTISLTGQFIGKLAYASPEQARGEPDKIDIRTDVYALGVILYQILTSGEFPYKVVGNVVEVLGNIVNERPTPPSKRIAAREAEKEQTRRRLRRRHPPAVNAVMEAIVLKALEKDPADRYQSAGELGRDIENYLAGQPTLARVAPRRIRLPRPRLPRISLPKLTRARLAIMVLFLGVALTGWAIVHYLSTEQPTPTDRPKPITENPTSLDPAQDFQVGTLWTGLGPKRQATVSISVLERKGEHFKARYNSSALVAEVSGTIHENKISWNLDDIDLIHRKTGVKPPSGEAAGTIDGDEITISRGVDGNGYVLRLKR